MERCETCENWKRSYLGRSKYHGSFTDNIEDSIDNKETDYGECTQPHFIESEEKAADLIKENIPVFTEDGNYGNSGALLYTHKEHCCKCWQRKEG